MANDIYFGSSNNRSGGQADPQGASPPQARRPRVERDPRQTAAAFTRSDPDADRQTRRPAVTRDPQPGNAPRPAESGGKAFQSPVRTAAEEQLITEQIDSELLHRAPTQIPFNYIDTEDGFDARKDGGRRSEKKRQKHKKKVARSARRDEKRARRKKKRGGARRFLRLVLCLLLAAALLTAGGAAFVITGYQPRPLSANAYVGESELLSHPAVYNLLLMGIDTQNAADSSRSDSMILLSVDNVHNKLKLTSFMRDCYVSIPGHGEAKLNAACTYGGPQLVRDTIEYNFGVRIDGCVKIGYETLVDLVDGVGGITVPEVDATEAAALAAEGYDAPIGTDVKMNGFQALQYCRIRKGQNDFYRTERQREVLGLLIRKALRTDPFTLALLGRKLIAQTECTLSRGELFALVFRVIPCLFGGVAGERIPLDGTWYDDTRDYQAVLVVNLEENTQFLKSFIYEN